MKTRHSKFEILLFCFGALMFGIVVYFVYYPKAVFSFMEMKNRELVNNRNKFSKMVEVHLLNGDTNSDNTIEQVKDVLAKRLSRMQYKVALEKVDKSNNTITYTISDITDLNALNMVMGYKGEFSCQEVYEADQLMGNVFELNELLKKRPRDKKLADDENANDVFGEVRVGDSVVNVDAMNKDEEANPLFEVFIPSTNGNQIIEGPTLGYIHANSIGTAMEYFTSPEAKRLFPADLKLCLSTNPVSDDIYALYAIKKTGTGPILTAKMVGSAKSDFNTIGLPEVMLDLIATGKIRFERATENASSGTEKKSLALLIDDAVISAPRVQTKIGTGKLGLPAKTGEEAMAIATLINSEKLPVGVSINVHD